MADFWEFFQKLLHPESIIQYGGLLLLVIVVFAENGVFFGFFLPGDSLLFTAGLLTATGVLPYDLYIVLLSVGAAAFFGYFFGYYFGYKTGAAIYHRKDSMFFKKKHIELAENYYNKYGGKTLIMGRFLPIIRTFAPILAGVIRMDLKRFLFFNLAGCVLWVGLLITIGYFVGASIPDAEQYLGYVVIALIVVTSIPIITGIIGSRKKKRGETEIVRIEEDQK